MVERIDPAKNAISGRLRLRTRTGARSRRSSCSPRPRGVWLAGSEGALRLDPRTGAGLALVAAPTADTEPSGVALGDEALCGRSAPTAGSERFDAATGAPLGDFTPGLRAPQFIGGLGGDLLALGPGRSPGSTGRPAACSGSARWASTSTRSTRPRA